MLDSYIIAKIKEEERRRKEEQSRPVLRIPIPEEEPLRNRRNPLSDAEKPVRGKIEIII